MFVVVFDNGEHIVERPGLTWKDVPRDRKIMSIGLTDGHELTRTLEGFDFYVACYEGTARRTVDVMGGKASFGHQIDERTQILYGIRDLTRHKRIVMGLKKEVHQQLVRIFAEPSVGSNHIALQAKRMRLAQLDEDVAAVLAKIDGIEVVRMTFGFTVENLTRDKMPISPEDWRDGVPFDIDSNFTSEARKKITREIGSAK